jgi:CheY-like chemotaxis protein
MSKRPRVLLIDSDAELLSELTGHCRAAGLEVFTAQDAVSGVALLEQQQPELLCLDDQLPGGDGLRLAEMVLASPEDVSCPVVILTRQAEPPRTPPAAEMCVYVLQKRPSLWRYLEPVIYELVDLPPVHPRPNDRQQGLSGRCP